MRSSTTAALIAASAVLGFAAGASAQSAAETAKQFAPSGKLRVGVLMLSYFAVEQDGQLKGWSPDLGVELARRLRVPPELVPIHNPADMIEAFKGGNIDVTFIGITKDRAAAFDFGPVMIGLRTTFLVPASAVTITFGWASSMRVARLGEANPPNTTEWMAPMRTVASMTKIASGIMGM